jgi:hypothetical protein
MPSLEEIAPDLAPYIDEAQAEAIVTATAAGPDPAPRISDLAELSTNNRQLLLLWLKWYRAKRVPLEIAALSTLLPGKVGAVGLAQATRWFLRQSPKSVASALNLELSFLQSLLAQVAAIRAEVARGEDAWMPAAVTPTILAVSLDTPSAGDVTIAGSDFDSYATKETSVTVTRPEVGSVSRTQTQIEAGGGSVTPTQIVLTASVLPQAVQPGDTIVVRADGLNSLTYTVQG